MIVDHVSESINLEPDSTFSGHVLQGSLKVLCQLEPILFRAAM